MTGKTSAGILLHRTTADGLEVLIGHMGGPFWARKDAGAWSIPKGEPAGDEALEDTARREFTEELGLPVPAGDLVPLGDVRQSGGKTVHVWALAADLDPAAVVPGTFELEWPPGSGVVRAYPEVDRVAWVPLADARAKLVTAQRAFLDRLADATGSDPEDDH
ncbi:NUDIX domain-containing protein [Saccharothrix obliqua]|uniref:NUDIX domain-containing protein n=1 Tax=Saccharothrix obliqua TaxID=2861747 RepID=UPI001C5DA14F|nr:NUDIX domain-containing protein [Saccharothrix obliqua]MBW4722087.1 NUDIX domain-containing protein [Saccharothrix obliqua]